jgi:hypothetical protein
MTEGTAKETVDVFDGYRLLTIAPRDWRFTILCLGDLHVGSPQFKENVFNRHIAWAVENKPYIILTGDLLECATKGSVGAGVYEQIEPPDAQIERAISLFEPVKHLIIGAVKGNHEERLHKDSGIDVYKSAICARLGVPYFGWEAFFLFRLRHYKSCLVYVCHSKAGSKNSPLALNWMAREMPAVIHADIYFKSHDHSTGWFPSTILEANPNTGKLCYRVRNFVATGNYLGRADSYAAGSVSGHKPAGTTAVEVDLKADKVKPIYLD